MSTTLVTGATGTLGREVLQNLLHREHIVRAYVRGTDSSVPGGVEVFSGDIKTGSGLSEAIRGVDAIVHCATSFEADNATDLEGARQQIEAARKNGSPHLVTVAVAKGLGFPSSRAADRLTACRATEPSAPPASTAIQIIRATPRFLQRTHVGGDAGLNCWGYAERLVNPPRSCTT